MTSKNYITKNKIIVSNSMLIINGTVTRVLHTLHNCICWSKQKAEMDNIEQGLDIIQYYTVSRIQSDYTMKIYLHTLKFHASHFPVWSNTIHGWCTRNVHHRKSHFLLEYLESQTGCNVMLKGLSHCVVAKLSQIEPIVPLYIWISNPN